MDANDSDSTSNSDIGRRCLVKKNVQSRGGLRGPSDNDSDCGAEARSESARLGGNAEIRNALSEVTSRGLREAGLDAMPCDRLIRRTPFGNNFEERLKAVRFSSGAQAQPAREHVPPTHPKASGGHTAGAPKLFSIAPTAAWKAPCDSRHRARPATDATWRGGNSAQHTTRRLTAQRQRTRQRAPCAPPPRAAGGP